MYLDIVLSLLLFNIFFDFFCKEILTLFEFLILKSIQENNPVEKIFSPIFLQVYHYNFRSQTFLFPYIRCET